MLRHGSACALEMVFDKEAGRVKRNVLWVVGGRGKIRNVRKEKYQ